jgi:hypothetical protein
MPAYPPIRKPLTGQVLRIIRYAMLAMVLMLGVVFYVLRSGRAADGPPASDLNAIRWVGYGLCAAALVAFAVLRKVRQNAPLEQRPTLSLVGSALGEASALLGGIYYFLGGDLTVYALGVVVFLYSWTALPADAEAP